MKLKLIQPFGGYAIGDEITDEDEIKRILDSEQAHYVVKVADDSKPDKPAAAKK